MHAHINIWKMTEAGESSSDTVARAIAEQLQAQPGFHAYTLVRTAPDEVVAITLFETRAQLHDALAALDTQARENLQQLAAGAPERREGDVILHAMNNAG